MKIIMVNKFYFQKGGSERVCFAQSSLMESAGCEVIPFAMQDERNRPTPYAGYFVKNIDYFQSAGLGEKIRSGLKIIYSQEAAGKITGLIKETRADLVHLHLFQHQLSPSIIWAVKEFGLPIIYTVHDLKPVCPIYTMLRNGKVCERCKPHNYFHCVLGRCSKGSLAGSSVLALEMYLHRFIGSYEKIDSFIAPSYFIKNMLVENGFSENKIQVLPNFLDPDEYQPNWDGKGYCLFVGRLSYEKGLLTLLKAMRQLRNISLKIAGTGPEEMAIKQFLEENEMVNVQLIGYQSGEELKRVIANAAFVVVPSEWYENCPMVVLESFASGKPVVASRIGGLPELIRDNDNGLLFEPKDYLELAEKINFLMQNPGKTKEMGQKARNDIETSFTPKIYLEKVMELYRKLL